jgi:hypothetical protein
MVVRLSTIRAGRPLPPGRFLVLISVRGWVDRGAIKEDVTARTPKESSAKFGCSAAEISWTIDGWGAGQRDQWHVFACHQRREEQNRSWFYNIPILGTSRMSVCEMRCLQSSLISFDQKEWVQFEDFLGDRNLSMEMLSSIRNFVFWVAIGSLSLCTAWR